MTTFLLIVMGILAGGVIALLLTLVMSRRRTGDGDVAQAIMTLQKELTSLQLAVKDQSMDLSRQLHDQLEKNSSLLKDTHETYAKSVGALQHKLGELYEATQNMVLIGRDISSLQDILKAPKIRGGLGELFLGELLKQILPEDHFELQFGFENGTKVDAVIKLGQGLIPVDAKFPLENFQRFLTNTDEKERQTARKAFVSDVKKHVDDIAGKYILPAEGTFEFALMYIPAENVYYETIIKEDGQAESISSYAISRKVIPVSPNSFYAYLQAIVRGLKGLRIEKSAQLILESLGQMEQDFLKFSEEFEKLGSHLSHARGAYEKTEKRFMRLRNRLETIEGRRSGELLAEPVEP